MSFTKQKNMSGAAVFLDFETAFDSIHLNGIICKNVLKSLNLVLNSSNG